MNDHGFRLLAIATILAVLCLVLFRFVSEAAGQDCTKAAPVFVGSPIPCNGVLAPALFAYQCVECVDVFLPLEKSRVETCEALRATNNRALEQIRAECQRTVDELHATAQKAAGIVRPWHESNWLWLGVGMLSGGAIVYALTK